MAILNPSALRTRGAAAAERYRSEGRNLVLIYCGVTALLSFCANGLYLYLESHIGGTGGLSGLGMRSVLQTIQEVLSYINMFFGPFWSAGFLYAVITMVRGRTPVTGNLLEGFRRFGRVLGQVMFQILIMMVLTIAAANAAAVIFSFTPLSADFAEALVPLLKDPAILAADGTLDPTKLPMDALVSAALPMLLITGAILVPLFIWLSYGFRMSVYLVLEQPMGGTRACLESMRLMRGHKWQMFRMDLSFWWYHGLGLLIALVGYADTLLGDLGIPLPLDPTVMFFLCLGAYFVLQTGLFLWKKCQVDAAYVLAYDAIVRSDAAKHE